MGFVQTLGDGIDLGQIGTQITSGISTAAQNLLNQAEQGVQSAANSAVNSATDAVGNVIRNATGQGAAPATGGVAIPVLAQPAERPVVTTPQTGSSAQGMMSKAKPFLLPAAVGVGVYLWRKSILWALGGAVAAHFIVPRLMQKGGSR